MPLVALAPYESWSFKVAWQSHPDGTPIWSDETARVDGVITVTEGRSDYNSTIQTSQLSVALRNHDQRFTPGNRTSPLWPNVKPARRCQLTDQVGNEEVSVFDGYIQLPEIVSWQKSDEDAPREQTFALSAVDRMGRLDRARPFISTLAEHIRHVGGDGLVAFWPMTEGTGSNSADHRGVAVTQGSLTLERRFDNVPEGADEPLIAFGSVSGPRGDDGRYPEFTPLMVAGDVALRVRLTQRALVGVSMSGSAEIGIACWFYPTSENVGSWQTMVARDNAFTRSIVFQITSTGFWETIVTTDAGLVTATSPVHAKWDLWQLVAVRLTVSSGAVAFWVDSTETTGSLGGASTGQFDSILVDAASPGSSAGNLQVYAGPAGTFTQAMMLAQRSMGWEGLARQRVDERITTIAGYAGIPATELHLDRASAVMPVAQLAGRRPGDLLREAAAADNGQILAHGDGHLTFLSRGRRYNPPLAATVQLTWLEEVAWRTDPPTNVADVSTTEGFEGHAVDTASVEEFGEYAPSLPQLDTAVDVDAANLAAHTVRYGNQPRQRPSRLVFQLRGGTSDEIRGAVLRREIGDRVHLDGLPANAPEGADQFHLEGMVHQISSFGHRVTWYTGPVVGSIPGTPDPLPKVGAAKVRHNTTITY